MLAHITNVLSSVKIVEQNLSRHKWMIWGYCCQITPKKYMAKKCIVDIITVHFLEALLSNHIFLAGQNLNK